MTTSDIERRRFTRINFDGETELKFNEQTCNVSLVDISFNGILVKSETPLPLKKGDQVEAVVHLLKDDFVIHTPATLAHQRGQEYGFLIENLDLDSLTLLRRLVELNLGEEALLERELDHFFASSDD